MAQSSQTAQEQEEEAVYRAMEGYYLNGRPPWDTGVTPPELVTLVEEHDGPPERVLELGCGTGTNAVYLARHGWDVTAVDLIDRAVEQAREKAEAEGVSVRVLQGDATRLDDLGVPGPFDLFFDLSCYCGIPLHRRDAYAAGLTGRAAPGARLLMFAYGGDAQHNPNPEIKSWDAGVTADELRTRFAGWEIVDLTPGTNQMPTFWVTLRRDS